jgi:ABC-type branched-subunit amino acid transport system substrate-binding protein
MKTSILTVRPQGGETAPADQVRGARLAAGAGIDVHEQHFDSDQPGDLAAKFTSWRGKVQGVVGALRVPDAQALGKIADEMGVLCFVGNNNPVVWQKRRHIFHIGYPTSQTTAAVAAELVQKTGRRRYLLLHDTSEFQTRVATTMEEKLRGSGTDVRALAYHPGDAVDLGDWTPELIYVVFSSERKALQIVQALADRFKDVPLLFGRSLLRDSFLQSLRGRAGEFWFVDTNFRRSGGRSESQQEFMRAMEQNGIKLPTTNHAFGWDCMLFCVAALTAGGGDPQRAIGYLESGVTLEGAGGACSFSPDNHNGRHGDGPTTISRWNNGKFEDV